MPGLVKGSSAVLDRGKAIPGLRSGPPAVKSKVRPLPGIGAPFSGIGAGVGAGSRPSIDLEVKEVEIPRPLGMEGLEGEASVGVPGVAVSEIPEELSPYVGELGTNLVEALRGGLTPAQLEGYGFSSEDVESAGKIREVLDTLGGIPGVLGEDHSVDPLVAIQGGIDPEYLVEKAGLDREIVDGAIQFLRDNVQVGEGGWLSHEVYDKLSTEGKEVLQKEGVEGFSRYLDSFLGSNVADGFVNPVTAIQAGVPDHVLLDAGIGLDVLEDAREHVSVLKELGQVQGAVNPDNSINVLVALRGGIDPDFLVEKAGLDRDSVQQLVGFLYGNVELSTGEWIPKDQYQSLSYGERQRLDKLGVEKYLQLVDTERRAFLTQNLQLKTGEWVSRRDYDKLSTPDRLTLDLLGASAYNELAKKTNKGTETVLQAYSMGKMFVPFGGKYQEPVFDPIMQSYTIDGRQYRIMEEIGLSQVPDSISTSISFVKVSPEEAKATAARFIAQQKFDQLVSGGRYGRDGVYNLGEILHYNKMSPQELELLFNKTDVDQAVTVARVAKSLDLYRFASSDDLIPAGYASDKYEAQRLYESGLQYDYNKWVQKEIFDKKSINTDDLRTVGWSNESITGLIQGWVDWRPLYQEQLYAPTFLPTGNKAVDLLWRPIWTVETYAPKIGKGIVAPLDPWFQGERSDFWGAYKEVLGIGADFIVPFYGTARHWDEMSTGWRAGALALDIATVVPVIGKGLRVGADVLRVGEEGARAAATAGKLSSGGIRIGAEVAARGDLKAAEQAASTALTTVRGELGTQRALVGETGRVLEGVQAKAARFGDVGLVHPVLGGSDYLVDLENLALGVGRQRTDLARMTLEHGQTVTKAYQDLRVVQGLKAASDAGGLSTKLGSVLYSGVAGGSRSAYGLATPAAWLGGGIILGDTVRRWDELTLPERALGLAVPAMVFGVPQTVISKGYRAGRGIYEFTTEPTRISTKVIEMPRTYRRGTGGMAKTPLTGMTERMKLATLKGRDTVLEKLYEGAGKTEGFELPGTQRSFFGGKLKYSPESIFQTVVPRVSFSATPMGEVFRVPYLKVKKMVEPFLFTSPYALSGFAEGTTAAGLKGSSPTYLAIFGGRIKQYKLPSIFKARTPGGYKKAIYASSEGGTLSHGLHTGPKVYGQVMETEFVTGVGTGIAQTKGGIQPWTRTSGSGAKVTIDPHYLMVEGARRYGFTPQEVAALRAKAVEAEFDHWRRMLSPFRGEAGERTVLHEFVQDRSETLRRVLGGIPGYGKLRTEWARLMGERASLESRLASTTSKSEARVLGEALDDVSSRISGLETEMGLMGSRAYRTPAGVTQFGAVRGVRPLVSGSTRPAVGEPTRPSMGESTRPAVGEPTRPAVGLSTRPAVGEPTRPSVGESTRPAVGLSTRLPVGESVRPLVSGPTRSSVGEPTRPSVGEPTRPSVRESTRLPMAESVRPAVGLSTRVTESRVGSRVSTPSRVLEDRPSRGVGVEVEEYSRPIRETVSRVEEIVRAPTRVEEVVRAPSRVEEIVRAPSRVGEFRVVEAGRPGRSIAESRVERSLREDRPSRGERPDSPVPREDRVPTREDRPSREDRPIRGEEPRLPRPKEGVPPHRIFWDLPEGDEEEKGRGFLLATEVTPRWKGRVLTSYVERAGHKSAQVRAVPKKGAKFVRWEGDIDPKQVKKNPVTIELDRDKRLVAVMSGGKETEIRKLPSMVIHLPTAPIAPIGAELGIGIGRRIKRSGWL